LRCSDGDARSWAVSLISVGGAVPEEVVPALAELLSDRDLSVCVRAAAALSGTAWEPHRVLRVLGRALDGGPPALVALAAGALAPRGVRQEQAVDLLLRGLDRDDGPSRHVLVAALGQAGPSAAKAVPELTALLNDRAAAAALRTAAAHALGQISRGGDE